MTTIESPGSFLNFQEQHPELPNEEIKMAYSSVLAEYRHQLADQAGITVEDLHDRGAGFGTAVLAEAGVEVA
jgi:hypothetical protein